VMGGLLAYRTYAPAALHGTALEVPHPLGHVTLLRDDARLADLADSGGKLRLIFFGYTRCPDVCPVTLGVLARAWDSLSAGQKAKLEVQLVSVDPAFDRPSKPIGSFMSAEEAELRRTRDGWQVVEDSGRGWRRVVASPAPQRILELEAVRTLLESGYVVVAAGGGGIPVTETAEGFIEGVEAVIDKDLGSALLARELGADVLLISTAVEAVAINFGKPDQRWLGQVTVAEAKEYLAEGHFGAGSMEPKIRAAISYVEASGGRAIITDPPNMVRALNGETGTSIVA